MPTQKPVSTSTPQDGEDHVRDCDDSDSDLSQHYPLPRLVINYFSPESVPV